MSPRWWGERTRDREMTRPGKGSSASHGKEDTHNTGETVGKTSQVNCIQTKIFMNIGTKVLPKGYYYSLPKRTFLSVVQVMSFTVFLK